MVNGIVRFREGIRVSTEGGLGSFVLRLAPSRHGRLLDLELVNPVLQSSGRQGRLCIQTPDKSGVWPGLWVFAALGAFLV